MVCQLIEALFSFGLFWSFCHSEWAIYQLSEPRYRAFMSNCVLIRCFWMQMMKKLKCRRFERVRFFIPVIFKKVYIGVAYHPQCPNTHI
jgi:hypothetical protein